MHSLTNILPLLNSRKDTIQFPMPPNSWAWEMLLTFSTFLDPTSKSLHSTLLQNPLLLWCSYHPTLWTIANTHWGKASQQLGRWYYYYPHFAERHRKVKVTWLANGRARILIPAVHAYLLPRQYAALSLWAHTMWITITLHPSLNIHYHLGTCTVTCTCRNTCTVSLKRI